MEINNDFTIIVQCPNCYEYIVVKKSELNCKIFRHGVFKDTYTQIDPHLPKLQCDKLVSENKIPPELSIKYISSTRLNIF